VLSEFRDRLIQGKAEHLLLDRMLAHFKDKGLVKARGRQRTDSTHVLAAIRLMNRLELVAETLRAALNDLAQMAPDWLNSIAFPEWYERYGRRVEQSRLPKSEAARLDFAQQVGHDGFVLLDALTGPNVPTKLTRLPVIETLGQVWERHYERTAEGKARWRAGPELSRAATAIESPYDVEARHSSKRDTVWTGYKAHVTESCDTDLPRLITHVHSTVATTQDVSCTEDIHQGLKQKELLPQVHLIDAGYVDAELLVQSTDQHSVTLLGPPRSDKSWQAREGGYDQSRFAIDWQRQKVTCPEGKTSLWWGAQSSPVDGVDASACIRVRFSRHDCDNCPSRSKCVRSTTGATTGSTTGRARTLVLYPQAQHEALRQARERMSSEEGRSEYRQRAGVEGTLSQAIRVAGLRHCRYRGLAKTHLQHTASAAAVNLGRVAAYLNGNKPAVTPVSRFCRARPASLAAA
jgi:transposase